jgi:acyl dehydratase
MAPPTILDAAPRLGPLYARAALGSMLGGGGQTLPPTVLVRPDVVPDPAHVAHYARVCGFALDDVLAPTYPHLLAFPLQVAVMAQRGFPLPLPGLVHVGNAITVHRPLRASEACTVRVHAEGLRAHPKGAQVDLVAEIRVGDEIVWEGLSTYLARGAAVPAGAQSGSAHPDAGGTVHARPTDPGEANRMDGPPTAVWQVDGGAGRRYAVVSGDVNPIHLHPLTARAFGFPRAIAHGMWTAARALACLQGRLPAALRYDVAFGRPVLLPSTVELRSRAVAGGWDLELRSRRGDTHLTATVRPADARPRDRHATRASDGATATGGTAPRPA